MFCSNRTDVSLGVTRELFSRDLSPSFSPLKLQHSCLPTSLSKFLFKGKQYIYRVPTEHFLQFVRDVLRIHILRVGYVSREWDTLIQGPPKLEIANEPQTLHFSMNLNATDSLLQRGLPHISLASVFMFATCISCQAVNLLQKPYL